MKRKLVEKSTTPPIIGDSSITEGTTIIFKPNNGSDSRLTGIVTEVFDEGFERTFYVVGEAVDDEGNVRGSITVDCKDVVGII